MQKRKSTKLNESYYQRKLKEELILRKFFVQINHADMFTSKGDPDIIACSPEGKFFAYEVKTPGFKHKFSEKQRRKLRNYHKYSDLVGGGWNSLEKQKCSYCGKVTLGELCFYCNKIKV